MSDSLHSTTVPTPNNDGEVVLPLASGYSLRSGGETFISGEYVRLVDPHGQEVLYWDQDEWATDPALVMGAIINAAITAASDAVTGPIYVWEEQITPPWGPFSSFTWFCQVGEDEANSICDVSRQGVIDDVFASYSAMHKPVNHLPIVDQRPPNRAPLTP